MLPWKRDKSRKWLYLLHQRLGICLMTCSVRKMLVVIHGSGEMFFSYLNLLFNFFLLWMFRTNEASTKGFLQYSEDNPNRYWSPEEPIYTSLFYSTGTPSNLILVLHVNWTSTNNRTQNRSWRSSHTQQSTRSNDKQRNVLYLFFSQITKRHLCGNLLQIMLWTSCRTTEWHTTTT